MSTRKDVAGGIARSAAAIAFALLLIGAAPAGSPAPPGKRSSSLLDFESPQDLAFVVADPAGMLAIDPRFARAGSRCLYLPPGLRTLTIKAPGLLQGRPFPAEWTLLGGYLYADEPTQVTISYEVGGRAGLSRALATGARAWTPIMLDLTALGGATHGEVGVVTFRFINNGTSAIRLDDVQLIDNRETLIAVEEWNVRREGLAYTIDAPGRFSFRLPSAQAQQGGWSAIEACDTRVRFSSTASPGSATIYSDGRLYWGGEFHVAARDLKDAVDQARQHALPGEITIPEAMGRLNRSSPGDADNDGYNETRGAYEIAATGSRIELTITPRGGVNVSRPVLEIAGLPAGAVRATMEGRLVPSAVRLSSGEVLVELPGVIDRATLINVRVK